MPASSDITERLRLSLSRHGEGLVCAYLFGSRARGDAGAGSDVDVAVLYREEPPPTLDGLGLGVARAVEAEIGLPVDLVVLNRASPDLIHRVLRDGVLLLENDGTARVHFEVKARAEYLDLLPYLRQYRRDGSSHDRP